MVNLDVISKPSGGEFTVRVIQIGRFHQPGFEIGPGFEIDAADISPRSDEMVPGFGGSTTEASDSPNAERRPDEIKLSPQRNRGDASVKKRLPCRVFEMSSGGRAA